MEAHVGKITDNLCDSQCSRCGECCGIGLPITRKEEKEIRKYIKDNNIKKQEIYDPVSNTLFVRCCFFDPNKKECTIYPVRPFICKLFKCNQNRETIEKNKIMAHDRAYWNGASKGNQLVENMTTFDWLFYDDPEPMIRLMDNYIPENIKMPRRMEILKQYLIQFGRQDIANIIVMKSENE